MESKNNLSFSNRDLISIKDLSKEEILYILEKSHEFKKNPHQALLKGKLMASCFYEPSTRTRLSFEAAMKKLGGEVIGFADAQVTSSKKGESLFDSMKIISQYADIIVIRHPLEGSARQAAIASKKPVINAGDGANEHPTQTLLDLFSIQECQGKLDGLNIVLAGDLKYGRTTHSLALAFKHFESRLYFVSPKNCMMPNEICDELRRTGVQFSCHTKIEEVLEKADILYMTRIQEERFSDRLEYEKTSQCYQLNSDTLEKVKDNLKIFHPLPRLKEIDTEIDQTKYAYYFTQAENGLYVRQALLSLILEQGTHYV